VGVSRETLAAALDRQGAPFVSVPAEVLDRLIALGREHELDERSLVRLGALLAALAAEPDPPTTVRAPAAAVDAHVADSLSGLAVANLREARRIADLGSGAGFPGLVLAAARPLARVDLVESSRRKAALIDRLARVASIANARAVAARAEEWAAAGSSAELPLADERPAAGSSAELPPADEPAAAGPSAELPPADEPAAAGPPVERPIGDERSLTAPVPAGGRESYDAVTARAVAPLAVLVEYAAPLLRADGVLVAWKGARDPDEEAAGAAAAERVGLRTEDVRKVEPFAGAERRHLHVLRKVAPTPAGLPRRPGMARKRPLR
jgi:16S rRNA G527 N7-methylase RsmG